MFLISPHILLIAREFLIACISSVLIHVLKSSETLPFIRSRNTLLKILPVAVLGRPRQI